MKNAPITEALIDFRTVVDEGVTAAEMERALLGIDFGYQRIGPIVSAEFGVQLAPGQAPEPQVLAPQPFQMLGTRLHSHDGKYVAQLTIQGFTLSRLAPYETWEKLEAEARRLWPIYVDAARPRTITRVATRYINELRLPLSSGDEFDKFLTTPVVVDDPAFASMSGFLLRHEVQDGPTEAAIVCTQLLRPLEVQEASVIIDIDVFRQANFGVDGESVWRYLDRLREVKNRLFFHLITEDCARLYE